MITTYYYQGYTIVKGIIVTNDNYMCFITKYIIGNNDNYFITKDIQ